ncbi:MAG: PD-(D/E)XK nuclease family protein, partial [Epsilonproteobacteria bacterium]|nr:PD-(D/E)XK nuclease family protein [Campylobacterota bacterium]
MTRVFSTNRGVREFYASYCGQNSLMPKAITISEFESKAIIVKDRVFIDNDTRFLLLKEATNFSEFGKLQFNPEFLTFLNHSQYIFKFFEELASEEINIDNLSSFDTYALYDEHIEALEILRQKYISLLNEKSYVDRINLSEIYSINDDYLQNLNSVEIKVDGFLSQYEIRLFEKCSRIVPFFVLLELNEYNKKTKKIFEDYGFELFENYKYKLDFSNKKIITSSPIATKNIDANVKIFNTRLSQIGFIFSQISEFIQEDIKPEDIVVVLPDESLVDFLKEFDRYDNLNFAMGFSLKNSSLFKKIEAVELYLNKNKDEQKTRVDRLKIPKELVDDIKEHWKKKTDKNKIIKILNKLLLLDEVQSKKEIFKEEIYKYSKFLSNLDLLTMEQSFKLFLARLKERSEDDVRGGKITVMGVLETRGGNFDGVIVPDFSDDFVPRRSQKDLFLNTNIRKNIGLPIKKDRENLQKFYYHKLFSNAKKVAISSIANETTMPSRFLDELSLSYELNIKT